MIAEKSCWEELLRKAAEKSCWERLLRRAAEKSCWERLLRKAAEKSCWEELLRKAAEKTCWEELLRPLLSSKMLLLLKISSFLFRRVGLVGRGGRQPSRHFVLVGRPKLWWNANSWARRATLNAKSDRRTPKTVVKCKFFTLPKQPLTQKVIVGRPKLWWNTNFLDCRSNP